MQDQVIYISKLNQILVNLQTYIKQIPLIEEAVSELIGENPILTDAERLQHTSDYRVTQLDCNTTILKPSAIEDFDVAPIQFLGFCAWKFVEAQGALIPGNPSMGVVKYDNRYYVFSCVEGALAFEKSPQKYIYEALDLARRKPHLINFLQLYDKLESMKSVSVLVTKTEEAIITHHAETQTLVHPISNKIDPTYKWNVWDLKRQAISMTDVSKRKTHSTQTDLSNNKNSVRLQTQEMVEKMCQTKRDNYTNVPTELNYVYGLRGRKDDKQMIITLTRPVDEE